MTKETKQTKRIDLTKVKEAYENTKTVSKKANT